MTDLMNFSNIYWLDGELSTYGEAAGKIDVDIAIIGGGMTAFSAASVFVESGIKTALFEKRLIASGASSRNAGFVITGPVEHYARAVKILGREKAKRLWIDSMEGIENIERNLEKFAINATIQKKGSLLLADSESEDNEARETVTELQKDGMNSRYISSGEISRKLQTNSFHGACALPDNFGFNPYQYVNGLANELSKSPHLSIYDQSEIISINTKNETIILKSEHAEISCQMVLIAANAWAQKIDPFFESKIIPVRGQVIATAPIDEIVWDEIIYANFGFEYFRQLPGRELIIGGWRENMPEGDAFHYNEYIDEKAVKGLQDYIYSKFPRIPELKVTHSWAGTMGFSRDGLPVMGPLPGENRIFTAGGYTGHGMAFGSIIVHDAAKAMLGELDKDISMYSPARFNK